MVCKNSTVPVPLGWDGTVPRKTWCRQGCGTGNRYRTGTLYVLYRYLLVVDGSSLSESSATVQYCTWYGSEKHWPKRHSNTKRSSRGEKPRKRTGDASSEFSFSWRRRNRSHTIISRSTGTVSSHFAVFTTLGPQWTLHIVLDFHKNMKPHHTVSVQYRQYRYCTTSADGALQCTYGTTVTTVGPSTGTVAIDGQKIN